LLRKPVSIIMLSLLVVSALILAYNVQPGNSDYVWTTTIYINADGSISPPTAPISSLDNVTYTLTDNIVGNVTAASDAIIIQRNNTIIDGAGHTIQGIQAANSIGVDLAFTNNVTIKNIKITMFDFGIWFYSCSNNRVSGNNITTNNYDGIYLNSSSNNSLIGNNMTNNGRYGIRLDSSSNSNVIGNNITNNNEDGIILGSCSNNSVSGNNITANNGEGISLNYSPNNSVSGNNITANNGEGISLYYSSNNSVSGNNITTNNNSGIALEFSNNNSVSGNSLVNCSLYVDYSYGNVVTGNSVNGKPLVYLEGVSNYVVGDAGQVILISCNNVTVGNLNLSNATIGVELWETNNTRISGNNMANNEVGIDLWFSSNNSVRGNNITNNVEGIYLYSSSNNNSVSGNNITANGLVGIAFDSSSDNTIYHNNFINNTYLQAYSYNLTNVWDNGYPSGGNYWSDYNGTDLYGGQYQNLTGYDGVGDAPYIIDSNNTDNYPLMRPVGGLGILEVQTPTGSNVSVSPVENVTVTFANVTAGGFTSWNTVQPPTDQFVSVTCNEIRTSVNYTGNVTLEFAYDPSGLSLQDQQAMKIWLWNDSSSCWVDVTTYINTTSHVVYGVSPHLSMFGVTSNLGITGDLNVTGTTTVSIPENPPPPPSYWMALNYYQINTTKSLPAPISLRLAYNYQSIQPGQELSVRIMMWNETSLRWVDITSGVNLTSHVVYGLAPHLSMFGVTCLQPSPTVGGGGGSRMPYMD
jgi:parallel beta-helix repeat protein